MNFMPYSFLKVNKVSEAYEAQERRFNYTTPKSFLELIALYKSMLAARREKTTTRSRSYVRRRDQARVDRRAGGRLEEDLKVKAVEVEAKKAEVEAMIPKLEEEKGKAGEEAAKANVIAARRPRRRPR